MALLRWCWVTLLIFALPFVHSDTTPEVPKPVNQYVTHELPKPVDKIQLQELPNMLTSEELKKTMNLGFEITNPTHVDGEELYESDIRLTPEQRNLIRERKAIADLAKRWPNGPGGYPIIPYIFNDALVNQTAVLAGIAHWEQNTCIRFQPATNTSLPHLKFIQDNGCWSYVGMIYFWSGQNISIGVGCTGVGTVAHEIGHAVGFHHEQSRSDRDDYVYINYGNIISGMEHNFDKEVDNNYSVPYDYTSDMHYGDDYFTKNGYPTMATLNPLAQELIGQRGGLSHYDKLLANTMYPCISNWLAACNIASNPCQNKGYMGPSCTCICPAGTTGNNCETVTGGYYDSLLSGCSQNVTTEGNITSPNYPNNYPANLKCVKWIRAPSDCYTVRLTFHSFRLYQQNAYCNGQLCCYFDSLEIKTDNPYNGTRYCDTMITAGQVFTSTSSQMILVFKTVSNYYKGWAASVEFIPSASCSTTSAASSTTTSTSTTSTPTSSSSSTTTTTSTSTSSTTSTSTPSTTSTSTSSTTSTSTPSTTSTSTSSTTTTTPSTTTITSTSSPITTTSSTCNETTPITTTTPNTQGACGLQTTNGADIWTSPGYPLKYPNNADCSLTRSSSSPKWATVTINDFNLQTPRRGNCLDWVSFSQPYNMGTIGLCGKKKGNFPLPSYNMVAKFHSNNLLNYKGFSIKITPKTSNCHLLVTTGGVGSNGTISASSSSGSWAKTGCEWWIESPPCTTIMLEFTKSKMNGKCKSNAVIVNREGDNTYPLNSLRFCGKAKPPTVISTGNKMTVLYYSSMKNSPLQARWTVL